VQAPLVATFIWETWHQSIRVGFYVAFIGVCTVATLLLSEAPVVEPKKSDREAS
jgi:Flp pilus assembly protein protease CpaA